MTIFVKVILGIGVAVAGGLIGLHLLLYLTLTFLAGFTAFAINRAFFSELSKQFQAITSEQNSRVISFMILAVVPVVSIGYAGRRLIATLGLGQDELQDQVNAILGSGYAVAVYTVILCIV